MPTGSHGNSSIVWCHVVWHSPIPHTVMNMLTAATNSSARTLAARLTMGGSRAWTTVMRIWMLAR